MSGWRCVDEAKDQQGQVVTSKDARYYSSTTCGAWPEAPNHNGDGGERVFDLPPLALSPARPSHYAVCGVSNLLYFEYYKHLDRVNHE